MSVLTGLAIVEDQSGALPRSVRGNNDLGLALEADLTVARSMALNGE